MILCLVLQIPEGTCDNAATDALSHGTSKLNAETMKSILDRVTVGTTERADAHDLAVAWADEEIHKAIPGNCNFDLSCMHRPTCDWLGDCSTWGSNTQGSNRMQISGQEVQGSQTPAGRWHKYWRWVRLFSKSERKLTFYQGALYNQPHPHWWAGRMICNSVAPKGSPGSCHEWMSPCNAGHQGQQWQTLRLLNGPCSGGLAWLVRCRGQSVAVSNASNMRVFVQKP